MDQGQLFPTVSHLLFLSGPLTQLLQAVRCSTKPSPSFPITESLARSPGNPQQSPQPWAPACLPDTLSPFPLLSQGTLLKLALCAINLRLIAEQATSTWVI